MGIVKVACGIGMKIWLIQHINERIFLPGQNFHALVMLEKFDTSSFFDLGSAFLKDDMIA